MTGAEQIADLIAQYSACSEGARRLLTENPPGLLTKRPASGGWSAAECVEHLTLSTRQYQPVITPALASALAGDGPYSMDFTSRLLRWILEPPYRHGVKTLPSFQPQSAAPPEQVLADFLRSQDDMLAWLAAARGKAIDRVKITSPFNQRMRYNLFGCFRALAAHQRRHLWQAERALAALQRSAGAAA